MRPYLKPTLAAVRAAASLLALVGLPFCSGRSSGVCSPGATQACLGPGRCPSAQVCEPSGESWAACACALCATNDAGAIDSASEAPASTDAACPPLASVTTLASGGYPASVVSDGVISYVLDHRREVDEYVMRRRNAAAEARGEIEARFPPVGIRARLLARRSSSGLA
jgi:hypothetical protein